MPKPSSATGPKPNNLRAGLPQLDVERMDVFSKLQPGSVKIAGSILRTVVDAFETGGLLDRLALLELSGDVGREKTLPLYS